MLIIIARFFLESNTTISRSYRKRERERKHLHPAVTSVYVTSVTREQAPHGCGTQWCEFSKDVLQYARRRGGEEEEEEARSLIWINKGAIIRGAFGDSFTRHIFASRFNPCSNGSFRSRFVETTPFIRERSAVKLREHGLIHGDRRRCIS